MIDSLESALIEDGDELLNETESAKILESKEALKERIDEGDYNALNLALKELESCSQFYVERRMNKNIQSVLKGLRPEQVK